MASSAAHKTDMGKEALRIIDEGMKTSQRNRSFDDIVLVVGNTGAGKSTVSKLIVNPEELKSVKVIDRYIILDSDEKISGGEDTTVSKTIIPELLVDDETNCAIYDLPGFCDTRNESIEIANAFLMKKVADQAKRVKLLFVINHSSLLTGETRLDLKVFLENSAELIKDPKKFAPAIGLVVTKVRGVVYEEEVIPGIVNYLTIAKRNLKLVISDESKRQAAEEILNAFLTRDSSGNYTKVVYFSETKKPGPVKDIPSVLQEREKISRLIQHNLRYVRSTPDDFGLSVSAKAHFLITKIADQLQLDIAEIITRIRSKLESEIETIVKKMRFVDIGTHVRIQEAFSERITKLQENRAVSREDFLKALLASVSFLKLSKAIAEETKELEKIQEYFKFLEKFSGCKFPSRILDWAMPVQFSAKSYRKVLREKVSIFDQEMESRLLQLANIIGASFQQKKEACGDDVEKISQLLDEYSNEVVQLNEALYKVKTVNKFTQQVRSTVNGLDSGIPTSNLVELLEDVDFRGASLNAMQWLRPFEDLQRMLREERRLHILQSQKKEEIEKLVVKSAEEMKQQHRRMEAMKEECFQSAKEQNDRLIAEAEELQNQLVRVKGDYEVGWKRHEEEAIREKAKLEKRMKQMERDLLGHTQMLQAEIEQFKRDEILDLVPIFGPIIKVLKRRLSK